MISYLSGTIKYKNEKSLTVLTDNIGYRVFVPLYILEKVKVGEKIELFTHLDITLREETLDLYGFKTQEELAFFKKLISITGVGPRSALGTLSLAKLPDLKKTISKGDPSLLQKVAGIGKKTAERIVVELKDKLEALDLKSQIPGISDQDLDAFEALIGLGYKPQEVRKVLREIPEKIEKAEERIKEALKRLGRKKGRGN